MKYNKLIRDKIPEIIKANNQVAKTHIADNKEYYQKLEQKLEEEVKEFLKDDDPAELADILEVIYAICNFKKITKQKLEQIRKAKLKERGGFKKRIVLDEVLKSIKNKKALKQAILEFGKSARKQRHLIVEQLAAIRSSSPQMATLASVMGLPRRENIFQCKNCPALGICGGGCPFQAEIEKGSIWDLDERFCIHAKLTLEWLIWDLLKQTQTG